MAKNSAPVPSPGPLTRGMTRGEFFAMTFGALTAVALGQQSLGAQRGGVTDASLGATGEPAAWTRFLGPNGTGVAPGGGYPTIGPSTLAWKRLLPMGKSSPVLTDKHIFLTAQRDTTPLVICLDKRTGEYPLGASGAGAAAREPAPQECSLGADPRDGWRERLLLVRGLRAHRPRLLRE